MNTVETTKTKKQSKKTSILDAALVLLAEKGYHETSIQDIADASGLTKGGLYHYVKSKDEILFLLHNRFIDKGLLMLEEIEKEILPPKEKFISLLKVHLEIIHEFKNEITFFYKELDKLPKDKYAIVSSKRDKYENIFMNVMEEGRIEGSFEVENSKISIYFILGASNFMYQWYNPNGDLGLEEITDIYLKVITKGIFN